MKLVISGWREYGDYDAFCRYMNHLYIDIDVVIVGTSRGVDKMAIKWCKENNIECDSHKAEWKKLGKAGGPLRNEDMAKKGDALVAFWNGESVGTKDMIEQAKLHGLDPIIVFVI